MDMEVSKILMSKNTRKDFGNMDELIASVKEKGVLEPLLINQKNELIAGERRFKAATAAGLKEVPVIVIDLDETNQAEIRIIENIQRKDLNPVEEGETFLGYMKETGHTDEYLAAKIGKTKDYIQRRISLLSATEPVKTALANKAIDLGHAVILSRLDSKSQKSALKEIVENDIPVQNLQRVLNNATISMNKASFDTHACSDCPFNGGSQMILTDAGNTLNGECLNPVCFKNKTCEWVKAEFGNLRTNGVNVQTEESLQALPFKRELRSWDSEYKKAIKTIEKAKDKKPDTYAVVFMNDPYTGLPEKKLFLIKEEKKNKIVNESAKKETKKVMLGAKVSEYKRQILLKETYARLEPGSKPAKILTLFALLSAEGLDWRIGEKLRDIADEIAELALSKRTPLEKKKKFDSSVQGLAMLTDEELEVYTKKALGVRWTHLGNDDLASTSNLIGFSIEKDWKVDEEYLKLYSKEELEALVKEFKLELKLTGKKENYIAEILSVLQPGQIPKLMRGC